MVIGALVMGSLLGPVQGAAADPFCPGNGPASLDPAFAPLVQRVGGDVVGSVMACPYRAGNTGIFNQPTSQGSLNHAPDGTVSFVSSSQSPAPNQTWTLRPDGTFITPGGQQIGIDPGRSLTGSSPAAPVAAAQPPPAAQPDPSPAATPAAVDASDDALPADAITPGRYACYAQFGGSSSRQVGRTGGGITKELYADGTWRDTSSGSMTATNPAYGGTWDFDGATLTLTWGTGSQDTFTPEVRGDGQPQLVQFGEQANMTCYLVQ